MRWLLHGAMTTPAAADALVRHGHQAQRAEDAPFEEVLLSARTGQLDLMTTDPKLVEAVFDQKLPFNRSIVFLQLEGGDVEQDDAVDRLFERYKRLTPGRLYTVTGSRVKVRQLPGQHR
jgi:hypothetical protein